MKKLEKKHELKKIRLELFPEKANKSPCIFSIKLSKFISRK